MENFSWIFTIKQHGPKFVTMRFMLFHFVIQNQPAIFGFDGRRPDAAGQFIPGFPQATALVDTVNIFISVLFIQTIKIIYHNFRGNGVQNSIFLFSAFSYFFRKKSPIFMYFTGRRNKNRFLPIETFRNKLGICMRIRQFFEILVKTNAISALCITQNRIIGISDGPVNNVNLSIMKTSSGIETGFGFPGSAASGSDNRIFVGSFEIKNRSLFLFDSYFFYYCFSFNGFWYLSLYYFFLLFKRGHICLHNELYPLRQSLR